MIHIGPITFDFQVIIDATHISAIYAMWVIFLKGGWVVIAIVLAKGFLDVWVFYITNRFIDTWEWVLLSIDVPSENIQSPKAVENILAHLAGSHNTPDLIETYYQGWAQEWFSLEIVSINGFIRFYIRTAVKIRDLVESAIYAQYPSAEISEAEDYVTHVPTKYPDKEWDMWGTEFVYVNKQAYPIKTYETFQDEISEEAKFKDPMAAMLETMSSLREGEEIWFQINIKPIEHRSWQHSSHKEVAKIAGIKEKENKTFLHKIMDIPEALFIGIVDALMPGTPASDKKMRDEPPSQMLYLTPGARESIEAIEGKASKIGFKTKIRFVYVAKKKVIHKPRAVYGIIGAMKQYTDEDLNGLKPELKRVGTQTRYWAVAMRKNWRKTKVTRAYKKRSLTRGNLPMVMNVEELATIWHFPVSESVKTPLVQKAESKRGEPPMELPTESPVEFMHKKVKKKELPPANLPTEKPIEQEDQEDFEVEEFDNPPGNLPVI